MNARLQGGNYGGDGYMQPVQELFSRIRWDADFGHGEFSLDYYDRVSNTLITVPLQEIYFDPDNHFAFGVADEIGETHWVPYHRVRAVYRNGNCIWQRV